MCLFVPDGAHEDVADALFHLSGDVLVKCVDGMIVTMLRRFLHTFTHKRKRFVFENGGFDVCSDIDGTLDIVDYGILQSIHN